MTLKLAVYAIIKNERPLVDDWMKSMAEADEIYVLDTGSTDGSAERLKELGAHVTRKVIKPWRFDIARNESLKLVPEDVNICACTDIDERFTPGWADTFKKVWTENPGTNQLCYHYVWNQVRQGNKMVDGVIFWYEKVHARHGFEWIYPCHEILRNSIPLRKLYVDSVTLRHMYMDKGHRSNYLPLLELGHKENPDDLRTLHYLAREYFFRGDNHNAKEYFLKHIKLSGQSGWHEEKGQSMLYLAKMFRTEGDLDTAEMWALRAVAEMDGREPTIFLAQLYCDQNRYWEAKHYADLALTIPRNQAYLRDPVCYGSLPHLLAQVADYHLGYREEAKTHAEECLRLEPENKQFQRNMGFYIPPMPPEPQRTTPEPGLATIGSQTSLVAPADVAAEPGADNRPCGFAPAIKKHKTIGIAVAANNIDKETIAAFLKNRQFLSPGDEIYINDKMTLGPYNPARQKNIALAEAIKAGHDIIVQTDIDMLLSCGLIEETRKSVEKGVHFFKRSHEEDGTYRPSTYGSWNALLSEEWLKTGGLDERMFGYGYEDTDFFYRSSQNRLQIIETRDNEPTHRHHRTQRKWLNINYIQQARNRALCDIPRQFNYLEARISNDYPFKHLDRVNLFANALCPRSCPECSRREVIKSDPDYEMSMEEVHFFLDCTERQGIKYKWLVLAGGEPLLWTNLLEALQLFKNSPFFKNVMVITAAISPRLYREMEPLVDKLAFSFYGEKPSYIPPNMEIWDSTRNHWNIKIGNKPEFLPADCMCRGIYIMKGRVYTCSQFPEYALRDKFSLENEYYSEPLTSNYQDICLGKDVYCGKYCSTCISNIKAHDFLGTVDNTKQKVYEIQ